MAQYRIIIDTNSQTKKEKRKDQLKTVTGNKPESTPNKEDSNIESIKAGAAGSILVSGAVGVVKNIGGIAIDQIGARTDNVAIQNTIDNILSVTGKGIGFVGVVAAGAKLGSAGGVYGAIAGGVAGAVVGIANEAVNIANKAMNYSRIQAEHVQKETMASERLGITAADRNRGR